MGRGTLREVRDKSGTLGDVRDGLRDPRGALGQVRGTTGRSGIGRETLVEVRDSSGDPPRGPGRVGGPSERYETSRGP